ncbi:MAG: hypothetical protein RMA76_38960 [Deltaproteobacteria bacterium]|jgi:hypothetical protein
MGFNVRRFRTAADLFNQLGLDGPAIAQQLAGQGGRPEDLMALSANLASLSGFGPEQLRSLMRSGIIAPGRGMPRPNGFTPLGYAPEAPSFSDLDPSSMSRLQRFLRADPFGRQMVERMLGGRIQPGPDGQLRVQPFTGGSSPDVGSSPARQMVREMLAGQPQGYSNAMMNGLANCCGGGGSNRCGGSAPSSSGCGGGGSASSVLSDPALTVEDKVALMLMIIMKQMDKQIEAQANYINALQQQQSGGKGGGKGGGGKGGGSAPSIDVETMKLKRLIDKRSQMFDMLRQIIDKYNETAKNLIQSIAR